ncbi:hypothetical protein DM2_3173 [Halorubrum sp. DM2]|nr:hypothetical protein BN903_8 [Halorubrum sp. AJ67]VTT87135.1 hypothetical protein DM2_3173 [Halorubrum sp. DM2]
MLATGGNGKRERTAPSGAAGPGRSRKAVGAAKRGSADA